MKTRLRFAWVLWLLLMAHETAAQSPAYRDTVFTEYFRRTAGWVASDGSISVPLPEGKTLWLMGDSYIDGFNPADTTIPCLFQVRNSILVQSILEPTEFTTILDNTQAGVNRTPIKASPPDATYFWPGHGYAKRDTAIVFWQQYSGANYTHVGTYVSKIATRNISDASSIKSLKKLDLPVDVEYGTAVLVDSAQNYIYIYGMIKDYIVFRPRVARVAMNKQVTGQWEYYSGTGWTTDEASAAQLMGSTADYVSPSYSVVKLQGKYYLFSQDVGFLTCGYGRDLYSWQSEKPEGPFTQKKLLYTIEDKYRGEYMITYNATAHPEFIKDNTILISYNVNGACTSHCGNAFTDRYNADLYRPKFVRVPLDYINPELNVPDPVYPIASPITGLASIDLSNSISLFPNPGNGKYTVEVRGVDANETLTMTITNTLGQPVLQQTSTSSSVAFELHLKGIYFVHITKTGALGVVRLISH